MPIFTRRSRRVAGLPPPSTSPVAAPEPAPAPTPAKRTGFRRTAARAVSSSNTPLVSVTNKKRNIDRVSSHDSSTNNTPSKRPRRLANANDLSPDTPDAQLKRELAAATPIRRHGLPGTPPLSVETPALPVTLSVVSISIQPYHDLISRVIFSLKALDGIPQDLTNILEVTEAIALWRSKNNDKPLPNVASMQRFLDENHKIPSSGSRKSPVTLPEYSTKSTMTAMATTQELDFSSTFRFPESSDEEDEDEDEIMPTAEGITTPTPAATARSSIPNPSGTFRVPDSPVSSDESSDEDEAAPPPKALTTPHAEDNSMNPDDETDGSLLNTPCPRTGAKKLSRSRSNSASNTTQAHSIFDDRRQTNGDATAFTATTPPPQDTQTPKSTSPHITPMPARAPLAHKILRPSARKMQPIGKSIMTANLIEYIEGQGINTRFPISQEIVDDFNKRMQSTGNKKENNSLEAEIALLADKGTFEPEIKEFYDLEGSLDADMIMQDMGAVDHDGRDKEDFMLEKLRASPFSGIVDGIPEDEFMDM